MSTANRSPSPGASINTPDRDHTADSDDSLARKRQRISEEPELRIEADEPEDMGGNLDHAIMIEDEDDLNGDAYPYSATFDVLNLMGTVEDELKALRHMVNSDQYLQPNILGSLANWLNRHLAETNHDQDRWQAKYTKDADFFMYLAELTHSILDCGDLIDAGVSSAHVQRIASDLYGALTRICLRITSFIPKFLEEPIARRDSVQPAAAAQHVPFATYISILAKILNDGTQFSGLLQRQFGMKAVSSGTKYPKMIIAQKSAIASLNAILLNLSISPRAYTDAWPVISDVTFILSRSFLAADKEYHAVVADGQTQVDLMFTTVNDYVVPAICQKHPRALPFNFHTHLTHLISAVLHNAVQHRPMSSVLDLYRAITSVENALPGGLVDEPATEQNLNEACRNNRKTLAELIRDLWLLQVLRGYVSTDILDIKSKGIVSLRVLLRESHQNHHDPKTEDVHPVLQYLARFLRIGNFTEYIFSADSHASLVKECSDVVGFLAVTGTYTDHETDLIWQACTTSVEAEFVKASFEVFRAMLGYAGPPQALHMARKYTQTPASALGVYAVHFLTEAFVKFHSLPSETELHLEPMNISFDILKRLDCDPPAPSTVPLRTAAINEIFALSAPTYSTDQRKTLYDKCVAEINGHTMHATSGMEILSLFLHTPSDQEAELILTMLPVRTAVDKLERFVRSDTPELECGAHSVLDATRIRLELVLYLVGLSDFAEDQGLEERLWNSTIGDAAISSRAREDALDCFIQAPQHAKIPASAVKLFHRGVDQYLPTMSADCATPRLVSFLYDKVQKAEKAAAPTDLVNILEDQSWQQLTRLATTASSDNVAAAGVSAVNDILFPKSLLPNHPQVAALQAAFARQHIEFLQSLQNEQDLSKRRVSIHRGIALLETIYHHSRAFIPQLLGNAQPIELPGSKEEDNRIEFTVHIHGPQSSPIARTVKALEDCHIVDLGKALQSTSGVTNHDLVLNGSLTRLEDVSTQTLQQVGIKPSSVVAIRPRYTFDCDFSKVFASTSPVEDEIRARFSHLESLLDGPDEIAEWVYNFISEVSPPMSTRRQILPAEVSIEEVFPHDRPWRTLYSIHVLTNHLRECNKLGVADQAFILHGAKLLSGLLMDSARPVAVKILLKALPSLIGFLQERPQDSPPPPYIEEPQKLGLRLFDLIEEIGQANISALLLTPQSVQVSVQAELTRLSYSVLLQLARTDDLWTLVEEDTRFISAHGSMLLSRDLTMSMTMSKVMIDFLKEKPELATGSYLKTLLALLPDAMSQGCFTTGFFTLFREVLLADRRATDSDERIRSIIDKLVQHLWQYRHTESPDNSMVDPTLFDLLTLLHCAVDVLKSFKQPLRLGNLAIDIWNNLLFKCHSSPSEAEILNHDIEEEPTARLALRASDKVAFPDAAVPEPSSAVDERAPNTDVSSEMLYYGSSRGVCMEIVRKLCDNAGAYGWLVDQVTSVTTRKDPFYVGAFPTGHFIRAPEACSGLSNLGMTCYMNSLLQQIYSNIQFRKFVFDTPVANPSEPDLLWHVKRLFAEMQDSNVPYVDTQALAKYLNISVDTQEDVHGFYTIFMSALEQCLPSPAATAEFNAMFSGKLATQVQGSCGHISARTEPFSDLSITVQNKTSLADSLAEFVQGEPMQGANKYKCLSCDAESGGKLVNAMRRTCLDDVPDHLTVCLKRFTFDMMGQESKNNDFFQFPEEIDLSKYERSSLEQTDGSASPDVFKLVGVIVHSGILTFGHYWSYVRLRHPDPRVSRWARLEDGHTRQAKGFEEVRSECFGGNNRTHNGYVLFYQRESSFEKTSAATATLPQGMLLRTDLPPRVNLPSDLCQEIRQDNIERHRIAQPFEEGFHALVIGLIAGYHLRTTNNSTDSPRHASATGDEPMGNGQLLGHGDSQLDASLARLAFNYLYNVLLGEKVSQKFLQFAHAFKNEAMANANLAHLFIAEIRNYPEVHLRAIDHEDGETRVAVKQLMKDCLAVMKEYDSEAYSTDLNSFVTAHASLMDHMGERHTKWIDYFVMPFDLSRLGSEENNAVVAAGYLTWILETAMDVHLNPQAHLGQLALCEAVRKRKASYHHLFSFIQLSMTHPDPYSSLDNFGPGGFWHAARSLTTLRGSQGAPVLPWMLAACREDGDCSSWRHFHPALIVNAMASSSDHRFRPILARSLISCFQSLPHFRPPLFLMAAAFIVACGDGDSSGKIIVTMIDCIKDCDRVPYRLGLELFETVYQEAAWNVVHSIPRWAPDWLHSGSGCPKRTQRFLSAHLFKPAPLNQTDEDPEVFGTPWDFLRSQTVRDLVDQCQEALLSGRDIGEGPSQQMHTVLHEANEYLVNLATVCHRVQQQTQNSERMSAEDDSADAEDGHVEQHVARLSGLIQEEYTRLADAQRRVQMLQAELQEWEDEQAPVEEEGESSVYDDTEDDDM